MFSQSNVLVAQSGGPTTVINASLAGVIARALEESSIQAIYGAKNGIQGVLNKNLVPLHAMFEGKDDFINQLKITPSMFLGSCRYKLPALEEESNDYKIIFEVFKEYNIGYFFYIGGNDSMDTVAKLSLYAKKIGYPIYIMGIPKTIDNDLVGIDHTPGFGSAAKHIATTMLEVAHDTAIYDMKSVVIVEIMGRNAGWLTASAVLARTEYSNAPHLVYLPETPFCTEQFIKDVQKSLETNKQVIVAVSEGVRDEAGNYISAKSNQVDQFGHVMLSGTGKYLEGLVQARIGCKVRSIELNVLQRCAAHISSQTDVEEAFALGRHGVEAALQGHTKEMVALTRISDTPYEVTFGTIDIELVANKEKMIPREWINELGNDVTEEMITYLKPLIEGQVELLYKNGVPSYLKLEKLGI